MWNLVRNQLLTAVIPLVIAAAKRARQIIAGDEPMADKITCPKPLSIAVEELYEGKVKIFQTQKMEE